MSQEQLAEWKRAVAETPVPGEAGDIDAALRLLRQPVPFGLPAHVIPFLQARCWERLGDLETALVFMKEADRLDPDQALSVLLLLQQLGQVDEIAAYAKRVIANPASPPLELYLAAVALLTHTRLMNDSEAAPTLRQVVPVLKRALSDYLALAPERQVECAHADADIAQALGLACERLGDLNSAIAVYNAAIDRNPRDGELLMFRGLALYEQHVRAALADFAKAVRLGVAAIWPYLLLARHAIQNGLPGDALRLALVAERQPGPAVARAEAYETIGMALAELGQPLARVLESFDQALALDPNNQRILENRKIAAAGSNLPPGGRALRQRLVKAPPIKPEDLRRARQDQIKDRFELRAGQRGNPVVGEPVAV
jgi:tetratricopeptide (TPR) repeat protein